jgi:hypothetical protein
MHWKHPSFLLLLLCAILVSCSAGLGGWLLMYPPVVEREGLYVVSSRASVQFWQQAEAFDSAAACEEARQHRMREGNHQEQVVAPATTRMGGPEAMKLAVSLGRCVPSDAVYSAREEWLPGSRGLRRPGDPP